jgi:hypothetical protein
MARWSVALAALVIVLGCGPSLRRVQQSRVYFERCYAADFDARIPLAEKHACWTAWTAHYTIGEAEDRADYARARIYAIEHGESVPRLPGLPSVALGPRASMPVTATAIEPDPEEELHDLAPTVEPRDRVVAPERRSRPMPSTDNPACASAACEPLWRECIDSCPETRSSGCETACEVELTACARGCF